MKGPEMEIEREKIKERTVIKGGNKRRKEGKKRILINSSRSLTRCGKRQVTSQVSDRGVWVDGGAIDSLWETGLTGR